MKRIIQGKTYDTATALLVAKDTYEGNDADVVECLYATTGGAYFVHEVRTHHADHRDQTGEYVDSKGRPIKEMHRISPLSPSEVDEWWRDAVQVEVFDDTVFATPDEASAKDYEERTVTFTLRIPEQMRDKLQKSAKAKGVSMNAYLLQCAESCLKAA